MWAWRNRYTGRIQYEHEDDHTSKGEKAGIAPSLTAFRKEPTLHFKCPASRTVRE